MSEVKHNISISGMRPEDGIHYNGQYGQVIGWSEQSSVIADAGVEVHVTVRMFLPHIHREAGATGDWGDGRNVQK